MFGRSEDIFEEERPKEEKVTRQERREEKLREKERKKQEKEDLKQQRAAFEEEMKGRELEEKRRKQLEKEDARNAKLAKKAEIPAFVVFSNATLADMAKKKPATMSEFKKVSGVGEIKAAWYGTAFLKCIQSYLDENA